MVSDERLKDLGLFTDKKDKTGRKQDSYLQTQK